MLSIPAFSAPLQIPPSLLGTHFVSFDSSSFPSFHLTQKLLGPFPEYGGSFQANIYTDDTLSSPPSRVTVWCVDYQLDVGVGSAYTENIKRLSDVAAPFDAGVRYGDVANPWSNPLTDLTGSGYDTTTVAYRYALTAALITQYENSSGVIAPDAPENNARNRSIQAAIWYIIYNTEYTPGATWLGFDIASGAPAGYNDWVQWAETNVNSVDKASWAVISGPASATGELSNPNGFVQTFLVQVAPEPTFYGMLMLGFGGLFIARRRRQG